MYNSDMEKIMRKYKKKKLTPMRAIKIYCKEMCCAGDLKSWKECSFESCPFFDLRLGRKKQSSEKRHRENIGFSEQKPLSAMKKEEEK